ncbi:MAG: NYN domain-containing protein [Oscillospiraceae bacterium]|nr:NYN domain-containing protein [Oscillospiraceae bacterium]
MKKVAVFFDGANCFFTQKKMGWLIDAEKLLNYCKQYGDLVEAIYYNGETEDSKQRCFLNKLAYIGYSLETKPVKTIRDYETGEITQKANLDIEIVLDMFNMIDRYDLAILVSGDGDFERAIRQLKSRGKEVKVLSTRCSVATEIVHALGINYIDFLTIREQIERKLDEPTETSAA